MTWGAQLRFGAMVLTQLDLDCHNSGKPREPLMEPKIESQVCTPECRYIHSTQWSKSTPPIRA